MQTNNYVDYLKSISQELDATKNRVRHLIRDRHWLTGGEHTEAVLRRILRDLMPDKLGVCHGFIVDESKEPSSQIDILMIDKLNKPGTTFGYGYTGKLYPARVCFSFPDRTYFKRSRISGKEKRNYCSCCFRYKFSIFYFQSR